MLWFQQCMCFGKEDKDSNVYYTASRPTRRQNEVDGPASSQSSNKNVPKSRRTFFFALKKQPPFASNPLLPQQERQHFNPDDIPNIDDPIPTYESVDATDSDIAYSVNERPRRYDYPTFKSKTNEEAVYASASQIYSGGSEDPYSSIVSDIEGSRQRGDDISVGYARVVEDITKPSTSRPMPARNVESLYAKINRNAVNKKINEANISSHPAGLQLVPQTVSQPIRSTSIHVQPRPAIVPSNVPVFDPSYQYDESGSGSITSNGSRNPSYKYLTVRETLGAIRERIRAREEGIILEAPGVGREHYYSTINNDYETVKDLRTLNVVTDTKTNPRPPTSPVPNHIPTMVRSFPCYQESAIHLIQSYYTQPRPVIISLAGLSRLGGSAPDINRPKKRSRIPIPIHRIHHQTPHTKSVPPKSNLNARGRMPGLDLKSDSTLFSPKGHDYVSLIDFGPEKGWPFTRT